jgi:hypothetical protein
VQVLGCERTLLELRCIRGLEAPGSLERRLHGGASHGGLSHSHTPLYISLVVLHTKYTGRRQNDFDVHA